MTRVGFTGTRLGMREAQRVRVRELFAELRPSEFHHGDCVGADEQAHAIAVEICVRTWFVAHPSNVKKLRAFTANDEIRPPAPFLQRNIHIVDDSDMLVATPGKLVEEAKGGTWHTVRHAREMKKPLIIVWPDGSVKRERVK